MSDYYDIEVCTDCYFAHHYGFRRAAVVIDGGDVWVVGPDFSYPENATELEPLGRLGDEEVTDNTCSNHDHEAIERGEQCPHCNGWDYDDGITPFSLSTCEGCGSSLGGARFRLAVHERH